MPRRRLKDDSQKLRQWPAIETYSGRWSDAQLRNVPKTIPGHKNDNNDGSIQSMSYLEQWKHF